MEWMFTIEEYRHILRIITEVDRWKEIRLDLDLKTREEVNRVFPSYLLVAYVKNLLEYLKLGEDEPHVAPRTIDMVRNCLSDIESVIMSRKFDDLECRAEIIRLYHDAGYQVAGQTRLEL